MSTLNRSIADFSEDPFIWIQLSFLWTNVARPSFLVETQPASVKCVIATWSALVQLFSCKKITRTLCLLAYWLLTQILFALKPSTFKCSIIGTNGPHLAFVDLSNLFCFQSRVSIILSAPRKHSDFTIIRLVIASYRDSPRGG